MTSFVNLLGSDIWSEADIVAYGRAVINSQVSEARQNELRTIMLGHIAQMRVATAEEMAEIMQVQQVTEAQVIENNAARADMALLAGVMAYEGALGRLSCDPFTEPLTLMEGDVEVDNPWVAQDLTERNEAQALIDTASSEVLALYALRNPERQSNG